ncbi:hypothetical protein EXN22_14875 [Pseudomonas tructae]|uniref:Uncharacterized protein n=1 Tax=Pseudomonas tructae TaxID=2518644 RepID=A0A411MJD7_9PSED|nr:hypothetical protein [Pseudomonas tructae]QBF26909.1 hypothetical protein EXN22_14875 [Pseudomonas tructae]
MSDLKADAAQSNTNELHPSALDTPVSELSPLSIFASVAPVSGYDAGVNLDTLQRSEQGVLTTVPAFREARQGDTLEFYFAATGERIGQPVTLRAEQVNQPVSHFLPKALFTAGAVGFFYRFFRQGALLARSRTLTLWVKLDRPGGNDSGHQGLVPVDVAVNPVTAEHLLDGVQVRIAFYQNKAIGDVIRLSWGGVMLSRTLQTQQEVDNPVLFTVPGSIIREAGDSANLVVSYEVHDLVHNTSLTWAPHVSVVVDTGYANLPAVTVPDLPGDGYIDLDALGDADLQLQVLATADEFSPGDRVRLRFTGYIDSGLPTHTDLEQFIRGTLPQTLTFSIANDRVRALAGGLVVVAYTLLTSAGELRSAHLTLGVRGTVQPLQEPSVNQADDELAYDVTRATVLIPPYIGRVAGHEIQLVWQGTQFDGRPTLHEQWRTVTVGQAAGNAAIPINVGSEHIRLLESGAVTLYYRVRMSNARAVGLRESAPLTLRVSVAPLLPLVQLDEPDDQLDPYFYPEGVVVTVAYPGSRAGDQVRFTWQGASSESSYGEVAVVQANGAALSFRVPQAVVQTGLASDVRLSYELEPVGGGRPLPSQERVLTLRSIAPQPTEPTLTGAQNGQYDAMLGLHGAQVLISYPGMRASDRIQLHWLGLPGAGTPSLNERPGSDSGSVTISVPPAAVGANINTPVRCFYSVLRNELAAVPSPELQVHIIAPAAAVLPQPRITQASELDQQLDLDSFAGDAQVTVQPWPFIALGQRVWLEVRGAGQSLALLSEHVLEQLDGLSVALPRSFLQALADSTALSLHLRVDFSRASGGPALDFPVREYQLRQGRLQLVVSDMGLAGVALPDTWQSDRHTCALTLQGWPGGRGSLEVNGSARFANGTQAMDFELDAHGECEVLLADALAETVLVSGRLEHGPLRHVRVRFTSVFPFDAQQEGDDEQVYGVRARAASGALANGRSANRVAFSAEGFSAVDYVQVQLSGSARIRGHEGPIVSVPLSASGDCLFEVIDPLVESVTVDFHLPQAGEWTRFSKTLYFTTVQAQQGRAEVDPDPRPWFMRVSEVEAIKDSHVRIPHMRLFTDHPAGFHGGIAKRALLADRQGLLVLVEPYLNMAVGDAIHIHFGDEDEPATPLPRVVLQGEVGELISLFVPEARVPRGENEVWFTVAALSGDNSDASARLKVKVKESLPGGPNPTPGDPHHGRLMAPSVPFGLIDEDVAEEGVTVYVQPWRNMEVGDVLNLFWGGVKVSHEVQEGEVRQIIPVFIDFATIQAGGDAEDLLVIYRLEDEVGNESDGASLPSYAFVEVSTFLLPRPVVADLDEEGYLDLGAMSGADAQVTVVADRPLGFETGDQVVITWRGFTEDAVVAPPHVSPAYTVRIIPPPHPIVHAIPNRELQAVAGGLAYVNYKVTRRGYVMQSRTTVIGIRGRAAGLLEPDVDGRDEDFLPDTLSRAVVRIQPWTGMFAGQRIRLVWQGRRGNGQNYAHMQDWTLSNSQVDKVVIFNLGAEHIVALAGGDLELFYLVFNGGPEPWVSESRTLWVGEPAPELISPQVLEAEGDVLDPDDLFVATVEAPIYTGMAPGQVVHLEWLSPVPAGNVYDSIPVTEARDLQFAVYEDDVRQSLGHQVRVRYIARETGQRSRYSHFRYLTIGAVLVNPPRPFIEEASGNVLDLISFDGDARVRVPVWQGISTSHHYWLRCEGVDADDRPLSVVLARQQQVSAIEVIHGVEHYVARDALSRFADNSTLRVIMAVALNGNTAEENAVPFPQREYQIRQVPVDRTPFFLDDAVGKLLILNTFTGNVRFRAAHWHGMAVGQLVNLGLTARVGGVIRRWPLLENERVTQGDMDGGMRRNIPRSFFANLAHNTAFTLTMWVDLNDGNAPVHFPDQEFLLFHSPVRLTCSSGGMQVRSFPERWPHTKAMNQLFVIGVPGTTVMLTAPFWVTFDNEQSYKTVVLDNLGEAQEPLLGHEYGTATIRANVAELGTAATTVGFTQAFPATIRHLNVVATNNAIANGRHKNTVIIEYPYYLSQPSHSITCHVNGQARFLANNSNRIVFNIGQSRGVIYLEVTNTVPQTVTLTVNGPYGGMDRKLKFS